MEDFSFLGDTTGQSIDAFDDIGLGIEKEIGEDPFGQHEDLFPSSSDRHPLSSFPDLPRSDSTDYLDPSNSALDFEGLPNLSSAPISSFSLNDPPSSSFPSNPSSSSSASPFQDRPGDSFNNYFQDSQNYSNDSKPKPNGNFSKPEDSLDFSNHSISFPHQPNNNLSASSSLPSNPSLHFQSNPNVKLDSASGQRSNPSQPFSQTFNSAPPFLPQSSLNQGRNGPLVPNSSHPSHSSLPLSSSSLPFSPSFNPSPQETNFNNLSVAQQAAFLNSQRRNLPPSQQPKVSHPSLQSSSINSALESAEELAKSKLVGNQINSGSRVPDNSVQSRIVGNTFQGALPIGMNPQGLPVVPVVPSQHPQTRLPVGPSQHNQLPVASFPLKRKIEEERDDPALVKKRAEMGLPLITTIERERILRPEYSKPFTCIEDAMAKLNAYKPILAFTQHLSETPDESWREIFIQNTKQLEERFEKLKAIHSKVEKRMHERPSQEELLLLEKLAAIAEKDSPPPTLQQLQQYQLMQQQLQQQQHNNPVASTNHHPTKSKGGTPHSITGLQ